MNDTYDLADEISLVDDATNTTTTALAEYSPTAAALNALRSQLVGKPYDVTTTKGMDEARRDRAMVRDLRVALEKKRVELKAPALERSRLIDTEAKRITAELEEIEAPIHRQIKAEEDRKAQEKADREAKEFGRILAMQEAVAEIGMAAMVNGKPSSEIAARLDAMKAGQLDPLVYQEMMPQAQEARIAAIAKLEQALKAAQWDEAEAARKAAEAEAARIKQAAEDAERARVSAEQVAEARRLQEARDMIAKAEREAAETLRAEREALAAEKAAWLAQQQAAAQQNTQSGPAPETSGSYATPEAKAAQAPVVGDEGTAAHAEERAASPVADDRPPINLGMIGDRLGFKLSRDFIEGELGIAASHQVKASVFWTEAQWPAITAALIRHIKGVEAS